MNIRRYVIDGGSLLQRIPWAVGKTFSELCEVYITHIQRNYSCEDVTVVFDSYPDRPTIKDITHIRRSTGQVTDVVFTEDMPCRMKKEVFLTNKRNKQQIINLLVKKLTEKSVSTIQAPDDADAFVVKTAVELSEFHEVTVLAEDTDILVLLLYHVDKSRNKITFKSEKHFFGKEAKHWDITKTAIMLGEDVCRVLPFVHAVTGCDSTSRIFGIGKSLALKKCINSEYFRAQGEVFNDKNSSRDAILKAGEEAISCLYGGLPLEGLQILRWRKFTSKTICSRAKSVLIQSLPPTPDAASLHCLRTYYQCQIWLHEVCMDPKEWGWQMEKEILVPKRMSLPAAPDALLSIIRCKCKSGCDTKRCSCRKKWTRLLCCL
jgi:hypothetical protein